MANDNTVLLGGDAADGIWEITDLLTNAQTSLDEMAVSAGNFGEQIAAQMNSVKGACDTASEAMNNLNQVQYEDLAGALETVKQHIKEVFLSYIQIFYSPAKTKKALPTNSQGRFHHENGRKKGARRPLM